MPDDGAGDGEQKEGAQGDHGHDGALGEVEGGVGAEEGHGEDDDHGGEDGDQEDVQVVLDGERRHGQGGGQCLLEKRKMILYFIQKNDDTTHKDAQQDVIEGHLAGDRRAAAQRQEGDEEDRQGDEEQRQKVAADKVLSLLAGE